MYEPTYTIKLCKFIIYDTGISEERFVRFNKNNIVWEHLWEIGDYILENHNITEITRCSEIYNEYYITHKFEINSRLYKIMVRV